MHDNEMMHPLLDDNMMHPQLDDAMYDNDKVHF